MVQHMHATSGATGADAEDGSKAEPIAVVGMGCRLPGGIGSPAELWKLLADRRDLIGPLPPARAGLHPAPEPGRTGDGPEAPAEAGYLDEVAGFDADFFGVSGREAEVLDPQHRLLLETAWEALEHAGLPPERLAGSATGVFTGICSEDYVDLLTGRPQELEGFGPTNAHSVAAGRISYLLGLHGPSLALDTACSSSLVALHLACRALQAGECDLALAGGVSLVLGERNTRSFARLGMLSPTGRCHPFDSRADGFVRGEGCGMVALRRLADALRDGERVLAVVRGSAVNQDGASDGLAAPSGDAQRALYRDVLARAGIDPGQVGMIEAHGTGTPVGDPVEFAGLAAVYGTGPDRCALGSVKSNLGHLEGAAGITGLIKAVGCLQHGAVPPNLHFTEWNPDIDAEGTRFFVPTSMTPWPVPERPRLAAVSSFGFSGTNAHVVLEQAPERRTAPVPGPRRPALAGPEVFLVPAGSPAVLPAAARRLADWVDGEGASVPLRDIAHTLALRRSPGRGRLGAVASSHDELADLLRTFAAGRSHPRVVSGAVGRAVTRKPVWVFSGQGSQWPGMGRGMLEREPAFAAALQEADRHLAPEAGFSVLETVRRGQPVSGCSRVQPVLYALQLALAATWREHGVEPAGVIGHSMGEVAASVVAGALSPADGARVICRRSALLERVAGAGAMASVALDAETVAAELAAAPPGTADAVSVAVLAAPESTVVSGAAAQVERLVAGWEERGVPASLIAVDVASHSPMVDPLLDELRAALADLAPGRPEVPMWSTVLDDPSQPPALDADYWCANLRRPVRFCTAVAAAAAERHQVYVELSPHPVVTHAVLGSLSGLFGEPVVRPTLLRGEDEQATFRTQLAALHCAGVPVDWSVRYRDADLAEVPTITLDRRRHWVDLGHRSGQPDAGGGADGPLPGTRTEVPGDPVRHCWRGETGTEVLPWLADHRVHGSPVLPGAAYCALALTVACELFDAPPHQVEITDVRFLEPLPTGGRSRISTTVTPSGPGQARCEIFSRAPADSTGPSTGADGGTEGAWVRHATAVLHHRTLAEQSRTASVETLAQRHPHQLDPAAFYRNLQGRGVHHGPAFTGIGSLHAAEHGESYWARVELPEPARTPQLALCIHPVLLDVCAQLLVARLTRQDDRSLTLPVGIDSVRIPGDPGTAVYGHARSPGDTTDGFTGHVRLLDGQGRPVVTMDGLRCARGGERAGPAVDSWFVEIGWRDCPRPEPAPAPQSAPALQSAPSVPSVQSGRWLVLGERDGAAAELARELRAAGAEAVAMAAYPDGAGAQEPLAALRERLAEQLYGHGAPPRAAVWLCEPPAEEQPEPNGTALPRTRALLALAQAAAAAPADPPRLYLVTRGARAVHAGESADPDQSALRGLVRVLASEHPELRATLVDTGPATAEPAAESSGGPAAQSPDGDGEAAGTGVPAAELARELLADGAEDEVALRGAARRAAVLQYAPVTEAERTAAATRTVRFGTDGFGLRVARPGDLDSLEYAVTGRRRPGPGEVEIRVRAAGLNFRDVLTAMGLLDGQGGAVAEDGRYRIGFECTGEVTETGPGVERVRPGDTVLAIALQGGAFGSFLTVSAQAVTPVPPALDPVAAAGLPVAFLTAWYALCQVARVRAGERVLIHSATGGTGLAAIAVARMLGAQVLATAGSEEKRRYLRGMRITRVMDSRSLDFRDQVLEATGGEGVDVVLNSLSGAAIRAGLETLRPFGRFVELGVRDIIADTPLGLGPLRHNIQMSTVDLSELQRHRPEECAALLDEVFTAFGDGRLKPLYCTAFPLSEAAEAFRTMAGARHIGKLVLTVPDEGETEAVLPHPLPTVAPGGAYIVTGGLRGLGLETARWLARRGAGHLVLNGRSRPDGAASRRLGELSAAGTKVTVVLGDVAEPDTTRRLLAAVAAEEAELRGVVHCAMVLDDAVTDNITDEQLAGVWAPKAAGAWQLHRATEDRPLDWFVLFSSMASLLGSPGQGAYATANAWLDGFARWRSARGLPTLAVNWGPWGETGAATDFAERGYETIPTERGLEALNTLLGHGRTTTGVIPGSPESWVPPAGGDSPFFSGLALPDRQDADASGRAGEVRARLTALPAGPARRSALESLLADHIRAVLRLGSSTLDPQTPLKTLGFDSLLAMELKIRLESAFGIRLTSSFVWQYPTLAELASGVAECMELDLTEE